MFSAFQESGAGTSLALDILLHELAEEAVFIPGACGAAIALRGAGNHFVCRAVAGEPTPAMGARIEAQDGLSAECVRTGRLQVCQDTEADSRVNAEMCRAWGVRSLVIVPLFLRQTLVGILEVFSPYADAFDRTSIERLISLGRYVVETVAFAERPEQFQPRLPERLTGPSWPESEAPRIEPPRIEAWTETPLLEPAVVSFARGDAEAAMQELRGPDRGGIGSGLESATESATAPPLRGDPTLTFSAPSVQPVRRRRNLGLALVALAAGLTAVAALLWLSLQDAKPGAASSIARQIARQVPPAPDPVGPDTASGSGARTASIRTAKPSPSSKFQTPTGASSSDSSNAGGLVVYEKGKVVYRARPGSRSMIGPATAGQTTLSQSTLGQPKGTSETPSPATIGQIAASHANVGSVTSAAETEKLRDTMDTATITGGKLIHQVDPVMPPEAAGLNLPDEVLLEGVIDRDGSVRDIRFLRGDARLSAAAIEAVRQWRYEPFRANGERVDMLSTLTVRFH